MAPTQKKQKVYVWYVDSALKQHNGAVVAVSFASQKWKHVFGDVSLSELLESFIKALFSHCGSQFSYLLILQPNWEPFYKLRTFWLVPIIHLDIN